MLKQRLLTAAIMIPLLLASVIWLPATYFAIFIGIISIIGAWEWAGFMQLSFPSQKIIYVTVFVVALGICWFVTSKFLDTAFYILLASMIWWLCALLLIFSFPKHTELCGYKIVSGIIGLMVLVPCWLSIATLHNNYEHGIQLVIYLFAVIAVADSGAYFGGRLLGRTKLAPRVSPGKSWEGVLSGLISVGILAYFSDAIVLRQSLDGYSIGIFIGITLLTAAFSIVGDLNESMFKRRVSLKDSGLILPGHGGVLDRIDSMTAAAPLFAICIRWFLGPDSYLLPLQSPY